MYVHIITRETVGLPPKKRCKGKKVMDILGQKEHYPKQGEIMFSRSTQAAFRRITSWWKGENLDRPCIGGISVIKPKKFELLSELNNPNRYWSFPDSEPNFEKLVEYWEKFIDSHLFFGETLPTLPHLWGNRGTPMTIAAYLSKRIRLTEDTVWIDPVIDNWNQFELKFDEDNVWFKRSYEFFKLVVERSDGGYLPQLPDLGDTMTVFSLLRGAGNLLLDIMDDKEKILEKRDKFLKLWLKFHGKFWYIYSQKFPGDISWLSWAPGKTYACQCDFSTMISPEMFIDFVVPEIEFLSKYLGYIIWHLDGPNEIKHLQILLSLPEVKAIQWVPGAGEPPAASKKWLPMLKMIQNKGKNLIVYANNKKEVKILINELSIRGLFIHMEDFVGKTEEQAKGLMDMVNSLSRIKSRT